MGKCNWNTGAGGRHIHHILRATPTTLPRVFWVTEAGQRVAKAAMCPSSILPGKASLLLPSCPDKMLKGGGGVHGWISWLNGQLLVLA